MGRESEMCTLKEVPNVEELVRINPDYVVKAITKWYDHIPEEERDRPLIGVFCTEASDQTYTPKQLHGEMMKTLKIRLTLEERSKSIAKMTNIPKGLLTEIISRYGDSE